MKKGIGHRDHKEHRLVNLAENRQRLRADAVGDDFQSGGTGGAVPSRIFSCFSCVSLSEIFPRSRLLYGE